MKRLWACWACLAVALACTMPAAAASIHRIVAVGDLHGDFPAWRAILRASQLANDTGRWIGGDAVLFQTGDVVDRGPDSLKIIKDLIRLQDEARSSHGQVIALVGNHEAMNVTGDLRYVSPSDYASYTDGKSVQRRENVYQSNKKLIETAYHQRDPQMSGDAIKQAWLQTTPLGSIEHRIAWDPRGAIGRWVVGNPAVALLDGNLFVHGGISPAYTRLPIAEINLQVADALKTRGTDPQAIINNPLGPLWYRGLATPNADTAEGLKAGPPAAPAPSVTVEPPIEDQLQSVLAAYGAKRIIIGHTPILSGIAVLYDGRLIRIDTGISSVYNGKVSYLEILDGTPIPHVVERPSTK